MTYSTRIKSLLAGGASALALATAAHAADFDIPPGDLKSALKAYAVQSGVALIASDEAVRGARTHGASGELTAEVALSRILDGTGFSTQRTASGAVVVVRKKSVAPAPAPVQRAPVQLAAASASSSVETIVVTSSKIKGDIQTVPIAITALSQEQLTSRQIAGGPDLVKEVPNLTFTKTNFTGYNVQIRGIGTQAISVTTDPAVAVSFNDVPFLRNHFFEQEFFDVSQVEVLRGPQGTLYGRNATAGVVNVISAKPTDQFEAQVSADWGNYSNRRYEGMVNIPVWSDKLDLRVAGEWTKRDGYAFNQETHNSIDGRDLWSARVSLRVHPFDGVTANLVWEHFQEDDDRARSTKQLCKRADAPAVVDGPAGPQTPTVTNWGIAYLAQGCQMVSLYSPEAFETPNASAIPFIEALGLLTPYLPRLTDPYSGATQSHNLRVISSMMDPQYQAKNDTFELNADVAVTPDLTLTSQTAYNKDRLYSTEDFNRYNTVENLWADPGGINTLVGQDGEYCDPQLGCSSRFVAQDVSQEKAHQFYQEVRLASTFKGPFNFVAGANYMNYKTREDYYVFSNAITLAAERFNTIFGHAFVADAPHIPFDPVAANSCDPVPAVPGTVINGLGGLGCEYIDPNPLGMTDGAGHNYFLSHNPYRLKSWAGFGELYYQVEPDVKLTGGLRYTDDKKSFDEYPSWTFLPGKGIPYQGTVDQEWQELTGRAVVNWTPKLDFTDQTLVYGSYAHGYKGGGANPPGVTAVTNGGQHNGLITSPSNETHPLTFKPEFNDAFEIGTKNTLMDGAMTLNADIFLYKYRNYQISQIVDRTSVNLNFDATVRGAELEAGWEPVPGLKFNFAGGYEDATINSGQSAIDLMDRTAGHPGWMVVKPTITATSNCVLPTYVVNETLTHVGLFAQACLDAYTVGYFRGDGTVNDPGTGHQYEPNPAGYPGYPGYNSLAGTPGDPDVGQNVYNGVDYLAPNFGEGFAKDVGGNQLPNAPHFTVSLTGDYTVPLSDDWAGTIHGDFYWQSQSFARVFNDRPYDKLRGYSTTNVALVLTNSDGWQIIGYVKNVFDKTAITGAFLNSDDTALTTNIFVTDPRLYGIRVTKNF